MAALSLNELHFSLSIMPNMFVLQKLYFFINHVTLQQKKNNTFLFSLLLWGLLWRSVLPGITQFTTVQ